MWRLDRLGRSLRHLIDTALRYAAQPRELTFDPESREKWIEIYGPLSRGEEGLLGAATRRAEAHVIRLAALYLGRKRSTISAWESGTQQPAFAAVIEVVDACGQHLGVGPAKADDSYDSLIRGQLRLTATERIRSLTLLADVGVPELLAELAGAGAKYTLIGRAAAAAHGWPISLDDPDALVELVPASAPDFATMAEHCGYVPLGAGRWARDRMTLLEHEQPPRTGGYADLARGAELMMIAGTPIRVASLIDLIRILEGDGYSNLRPFGAALWRRLRWSAAASATRSHRRPTTRRRPHDGRASARPGPRADPRGPAAARGALRRYRPRRVAEPRLERPDRRRRPHALPGARQPRVVCV